MAVTTVGAEGQAITFPVPTTRAEYRELLTRREELSSQLMNVASRRREIASEIDATGNAAIRTGLEDRLRVLDARILQLEADLATSGRQLATAPAEIMTTQSSSQQGGEGHFEEGLVIGGFSVFFAAAAAFLFMRRRWMKRMGRAGAKSQLGNDSAERFERLEQGMDAIAIEIERVSEGQRFVTRLLSESNSSPLANAQRIGNPAGVEPEKSRKR